MKRVLRGVLLVALGATTAEAQHAARNPQGCATAPVDSTCAGRLALLAFHKEDSTAKLKVVDVQHSDSGFVIKLVRRRPVTKDHHGNVTAELGGGGIVYVDRRGRTAIVQRFK